MPPRTGLGELEQMILLTIVALDNEPSGLQISQALQVRANRHVTKGALYSTLQRLRDKGYLAAATSVADVEEYPRRHFSPTESGIAALRRSTQGVAGLLADAADVLNG